MTFDSSRSRTKCLAKTIPRPTTSRQHHHCQGAICLNNQIFSTLSCPKRSQYHKKDVDCRTSPGHCEEELRVLAAVPLCLSSASLNLYPIDKTQNVASAMQYYFEVFIPQVHPRKDIPKGLKVKDFFSETIKYTMADPMWFSATVAFAELMKQRTVLGTSAKSQEILRHQSRAVKELRKRLLDERAVFDDLLLLTITTLMSIDLAARDLTSWKAHVAGMERIISIRGGLQSSGIDVYVRNKIIGFQTFWLYKQMCLSSGPKDGSYPDHPFPSDVCIAVSSMPYDLSEMAIQGYLSISLIMLMADVCKISTKFVSGEPKRSEDIRRMKCLAYEFEELFDIPTLTWIEQVMAAAMIGYCISLDADRETHWLLAGALQISVARNVCVGVGYDAALHNVLVWLGAMLVACNEPDALAVKLGHRVLSACSDRKPLHGDCVLETCHTFIWDHDALTPKLQENLMSDLLLT